MTLKIIFELTKPRITIASTLTAALGYTLARGKVDLHIIPVLIGGFLLAAASAALNQIQEANLDKKVERTASRPIPSGRTTEKKALSVSVILFIIGSALLYIYYGYLTVILGLLAAFLYNGIYTPLKKITPLAAIPGAVIGAIPPMVGWVAAEGYLIDPRIYYLCFFFFVWQIPHFWLLQLYFSEQYKLSDLPSMFDSFSEKRIKQLTFSGLAATAVTGILLPTYLIIQPKIIGIIISLFGLAILIRAFSLLRKSKVDAESTSINKSYRKRFMEINLYALLVTVLIIITSII